MVKFSKQNGISIRGHNVIWDDPNMQPGWLKSLSTEEIGKAAEKRINSVVPRYRGQLIAWDAVNENLHFRFFDDKLGENASAAFFSTAQQLEPGTIMFMNESIPLNIVTKRKQVQSTTRRNLKRSYRIPEMLT